MNGESLTPIAALSTRARRRAENVEAFIGSNSVLCHLDASSLLRFSCTSTTLRSKANTFAAHAAVAKFGPRAIPADGQQQTSTRRWCQLNQQAELSLHLQAQVIKLHGYVPKMPQTSWQSLQQEREWVDARLRDCFSKLARVDPLVLAVRDIGPLKLLTNPTTAITTISHLHLLGDNMQWLEELPDLRDVLDRSWRRCADFVIDRMNNETDAVHRLRAVAWFESEHVPLHVVEHAANALVSRLADPEAKIRYQALRCLSTLELSAPAVLDSYEDALREAQNDFYTMCRNLASWICMRIRGRAAFYAAAPRTPTKSRPTTTTNAPRSYDPSMDDPGQRERECAALSLAVQGWYRSMGINGEGTGALYRILDEGRGARGHP